MNSGEQLTLYSTEGCHLCEEAYSILAGLELQPKVVDIAFDEGLFLRYGVTIPVLVWGKNELNWPFNTEQLQNWLDEHGITYHK